MSRYQVMVVGLCILLNALDGFDVLAISFASPGIAAEWGINRAALGVVLAMELVGMAVGSITLGGLADRYGRRPTILLCLVLMTAGMYAASLSSSVTELLIVRFFTGLGIGGMLASTNAMTAEFSNARYRNLAVILMAAGYPMGAIAGGAVANYLLATQDWRAVFSFGAIWTGAFLVLVWFTLPESIDYLLGRRPAKALERVNRSLQRMGHQTLSALPTLATQTREVSYKVLFSSRFRLVTVLLIIAYFAHIMTFYYILKWIPKLVVDMGYEPAAAGGVLVWANVGGAVGALLLGLISTRVQLGRLLVVVLVMAFVMVTAFGLDYRDLTQLSMVSAATGFFTNAGVVGFYALISNAYPADVRASGTGVVIGIGRGGAALGPVVAGFLFIQGFELFWVSVVMGSGALVAAVAVLCMRQPVPQATTQAAS